MKIPKLGVNIDHVATLRQARKTFEPDPVTAAALATLGGAEVITAHLREDRRHIGDRDLRLLRETVFTKLNLEMACTPEILRIALKTRPEQVTLVPEKRAEITTEGGLDVARARPSLARDITRLKKEGILVSLFVDAELDQVRASARQGADAVELHTGPYANARSESAQMRHVERLLQAAEEATRLGLRVNAGHGLTYANVRRLVGALQVEELHIGHSLIARAVMVGMERAAREMCELIARYSKKV